MSRVPLNAIKSKEQIPLGEILWASFTRTMKGLFVGAVSLIGFVAAPIWHSPSRMKFLARWLFLTFGLLVFLWVMFWIGQRPVFTIKQIQIESVNGQDLKHVNTALIRSLVIGKLTGNFFSIHLDQTRAAFENIPWVRAASVRRVWPNGLSIVIEEQAPIGIWMDQSEPKLVNTYGELFTANLAEQDGALINFQGPEGSSKEVVEVCRQINEWFKPWQTSVASLSLSSRYDWSVKLENGMRFELGRDLDQKDRKQMNARLDRFFKVWPNVKDNWPEKIDLVDLRYPNGFAISLARKGDNKSVADKNINLANQTDNERKQDALNEDLSQALASMSIDNKKIEKKKIKSDSKLRSTINE
ncbi:MAG: cell division protein FtsQ/DivIB [Betaproteobacteria bacterium]|jgi:cell division protein FtsQ